MEKERIMLQLQNIIPQENILEDEPMKKHTSFKIGGNAEFFVKVETLEQLQKILEFTQENDIQLTVVGNGSNLLVKDSGIRGIVAKFSIQGINININTTDGKAEITVKSGTPIGFLAQKLYQEEITGFEELSGIPGTIGGAVVMNAGAHGKEMKDILTEITAIDYEGKIHKFSNKEAEFAYRKSMFSNEKYIIVEAKLELQKGKKEEIKEKMDTYKQYRKEKQPIEYSSAGSTFKRGENFITAKLIDELGLKGFQVGGAQVSEKHAGFIINKENATADDVLKLTQIIKEKVYEKYGKKIELEVKIIGE